MHPTQVLHTLLKKSVPFIHAKRLTALIAAVDSVLSGASVSITGLGRYLPGEAFLKHKIKRMDRLMGNAHLMQERIAIYRLLTHRLLRGLARPLIVIDWSDLTPDQEWQLLRAALPVGGRSLTLYEEIHPRSKLGNRKIQHRFLTTLQRLLPASVCPIVIADSGFRVPFFQAVEQLRWHWLGRIRNRDFVTFDADRSDPDWFPAKRLYRHATKTPRHLGHVEWVRKHPLSGRLVTVAPKPQGRIEKNRLGLSAQANRSRKNAAREKEPWLLVASPSLSALSAKLIVRLYRCRMQIEEGFRDTKSNSYGLALAQQSRIQPERLANLLLIAALATFLLWLIGECAKDTPAAKAAQVNTVSKRSVYSAVFLARILLQHTDFRISQKNILYSRQFITRYYDRLFTP